MSSAAQMENTFVLNVLQELDHSFTIAIFCSSITRGEERGCVGSWWGNRRERDHWGDLGVDWWIILGWISRRWDVGMWTGLGWPRIETGGGHL